MRQGSAAFHPSKVDKMIANEKKGNSLRSKKAITLQCHKLPVTLIKN